MPMSARVARRNSSVWGRVRATSVNPSSRNQFSTTASVVLSLMRGESRSKA